MSRGIAVAEEQFGRGVWKARWRKDGCDVLIAIDSKEEFVKSVVLRPGVDVYRATQYLERVLEEKDPQRPRLELMKAPDQDEILANMDRLYREMSAATAASHDLAYRIKAMTGRSKLAIRPVRFSE